MRDLLRYALRGAMSGLLSCSPGMLPALWGEPGLSFWGWALSIWWAPGVCFGLLVAVPLAIEHKRSRIGVAVALFASATAYLVALGLLGWEVLDKSWIGPPVVGAVGAAIVASGVLSWRETATVRVVLLTILAGAISALVFSEDFLDLPGNRRFMNMLGVGVRFAIWQSATAASLSLSLAGRYSVRLAPLSATTRKAPSQHFDGPGIGYSSLCK